MPLEPGTRFGRYEISELLGRGGMGEVYRAQDTLLRRRVALKVLRAGPDASEDAAARLLREARAAAGLDHPNAISIYDVGEVDGVPFLAMELIVGRTLRAYVGDADVPLGQRIRWLADVARALGAAHQRGLVHRDVKPENVMVREDGFVRVLDFGIARRAKPPTDPQATTEAGIAGTVTASGVVVGTPLYMAPEQMRGEPLDGRADQFAWGVVAYELLTGQLPWAPDSGGLQLVAQILSGEIEPPRAKNAEIPAAVDAAVRVALSKAPADRFARMEKLADELEPYAAVAGESSGPLREKASSLPGEAAETAAGTRPNKPAASEPRVASVSAGREGMRWRGGVVVAAVIVGAATLAGAAWRGRAREAHGAGSAAMDAGTLAETESQMSANAEATAAYRAGMQAWRDAAMGTAAQQLGRALELDPTFAAAHLRRALLAEDTVLTEMRDDLQGARNSRSSLGTHDRTVLDALEPWTLVPPDLLESRRRFELALREHPSSFDFAYLLGWTIRQTFDHVRADAAFDRALADDPTFAAGWWMKGRERVALDDVAGAMAAYGKCLEVAPGATSCLGDLIELQANEGKCEEMANTSRRFIAVAPQVPDSYISLAQALFGVGAPREAVRAAFRQGRERLPPPFRPQRELGEQASLAMIDGRFDEAEHALRAWDELLAQVATDVWHFVVAYQRVLVALETGRDADALKIADRYLEQRPAWVADDFSMEPTIAIHAARLAAGGISRTQFAKLREEWLAREQKRVARVGIVNAATEGTRWVFGDALAVMTAENAAAALASLPDAHPLVEASLFSPDMGEPIGRAYLLAGRPEEATSALKRAAGSCAALIGFRPIFATWARFELGKALEARGDAAAACAEYRRVVDRWGAAKPPSRTAAKASARLAALRCAP